MMMSLTVLILFFTSIVVAVDGSKFRLVSKSGYSIIVCEDCQDYAVLLCTTSALAGQGFKKDDPQSPLWMRWKAGMDTDLENITTNGTNYIRNTLNNNESLLLISKDELRQENSGDVYLCFNTDSEDEPSALRDDYGVTITVIPKARCAEHKTTTAGTTSSSITTKDRATSRRMDKTSSSSAAAATPYYRIIGENQKQKIQNQANDAANQDKEQSTKSETTMMILLVVIIIIGCINAGLIVWRTKAKGKPPNDRNHKEHDMEMEESQRGLMNGNIPNDTPTDG